MCVQRNASYPLCSLPLRNKTSEFFASRKVYAILSLQLVVTFGIVAIFVFIPDVKQFAIDTPALFYSAIGITFVLIIVLVCGGNIRRRTPYNYIALCLFTIAEGYLLGCASATYDAWEVTLAIGVTLIVTIGLTIFAFQVSNILSLSLYPYT